MKSWEVIPPLALALDLDLALTLALALALALALSHPRADGAADGLGGYAVRSAQMVP